MKKLIVLALASISLVACRKDEDKKSSEASIVGTWKKVREVVYDGKTKAILKTENANDCEAKTRMILNNDGTTNSDVYELQNGTCFHYRYTGNYKYDSYSKKIAVKENSDIEKTIDVRTLNETTLEIVSDYPDENKDGVFDVNVFVYERVK